MNLEKARFNMVEQQIRPFRVPDPEVLDPFFIVQREDFVPSACRLLAFAEAEIPLGHGASMLPPLLEAHALQALKVHRGDKVLEIGTGSGYMAALLAVHGTQVLSVEIVPDLAEAARATLTRLDIGNVTIAIGDAAEGWNDQAPYDVIMVSGGLPALPQTLLDQLKVGGRLVAFVGEAPLMEMQLVTRTTEKTFDKVTLMETLVPMLTTRKTSGFAF